VVARKRPKAGGTETAGPEPIPASAELDRIADAALAALAARLRALPADSEGRTTMILDPGEWRDVLVALEYLRGQPERSRDHARLWGRWKLERARRGPGRRGQRHDRARLTAEYLRLLAAPEGQPLPPLADVSEALRATWPLLANAPDGDPGGYVLPGVMPRVTRDRSDLVEAPRTVRALLLLAAHHDHDPINLLRLLERERTEQVDEKGEQAHFELPSRAKVEHFLH